MEKKKKDEKSEIFEIFTRNLSHIKSLQHIELSQDDFDSKIFNSVDSNLFLLPKLTYLNMHGYIDIQNIPFFL